MSPLVPLYPGGLGGPGWTRLDSEFFFLLFFYFFHKIYNFTPWVLKDKNRKNVNKTVLTSTTQMAFIEMNKSGHLSLRKNTKGKFELVVSLLKEKHDQNIRTSRFLAAELSECFSPLLEFTRRPVDVSSKDCIYYCDDWRSQ